MLRRNAGGLRRNRRSQEEDVNPMTYMANLSDAMLVLAVGIMLALVISWNVQISSNGKVTANKSSTEVSADDASAQFKENDMKETDEKDLKDSSKLEKAGEVYYDSASGTYYIIKSDVTKAEVK